MQPLTVEVMQLIQQCIYYEISQYEISAANVSMDSVRCCVWSVFEQSVLSDFHL